MSPKLIRWVGGVRCLGLFPKKIDFFLTPSLSGRAPHQPKKVLKMDVEGLTGAATMLYSVHVQKRQMVGRLEVVHLFNKQ